MPRNHSNLTTSQHPVLPLSGITPAEISSTDLFRISIVLKWCRNTPVLIPLSDFPVLCQNRITPKTSRMVDPIFPESGRASSPSSKISQDHRETHDIPRRSSSSIFGETPGKGLFPLQSTHSGLRLSFSDSLAPEQNGRTSSPLPFCSPGKLRTLLPEIGSFCLLGNLFLRSLFPIPRNCLYRKTKNLVPGTADRQYTDNRTFPISAPSCLYRVFPHPLLSSPSLFFFRSHFHPLDRRLVYVLSRLA